MVAKSMDDIVAADKRAGGHYFGPGEMKGFKCLLYAETFDAGQDVTLFVTSEKPPHSPRGWTLCLSAANGRVDRLSGTRRYGTKAKALKVAEQVAQWWRTDTGPEGNALDDWLADPRWPYKGTNDGS